MFEWGCYAIGCRDDGALMYWDVERDDKIHKEIILAGESFWSQVHGPIPNALEPDDRRCQSCEFRVTCQGSALVQLEPEGELVPAPELSGLVAEKIDRDALYDQAVELCEETDEELKTRLGDRQAVIVNGHPLYHRPQKGRTLYDGKELLEAYRKARSIVIRAVIGKLDASKPPEELQVELDAEMDKFGVPSSEVFISESKPSRPLRLYPAKGGSEMAQDLELASSQRAQNAIQIFTGGGMQAILEGIESKVRAIKLDPSTATGREEIRSVAYKITRTKTALDAEGKKLTEGWRDATASGECRAQEESADRLEALQEEIRKRSNRF